MHEQWLPEGEELEQYVGQLTPAEAAEYLNNLAELASQKAPQRIAEYARRAYEYALRADSEKAQAEACRLLGIAALYNGAYGDAQRWFERAYALFTRLGEQEKLLHTLVNWALVDHAVGAHTQALERLQQALDSRIEAFPALHLKALSNMGIIIAELGHHEQALRIFEEVAVNAERQGSLQTLARACNNAALLLATRGEYEKALEYQQRSLQLKEQLGDTYGVAIAHATLGYLLAQMGRAAEARQAYERSLSLRQQIGDRRGIGYTLTSLGELAQQQGALDEAARLLSEAAQIADELAERTLQLHVARQLAALHRQRGDTQAALYFFQRSLTLMDELLSERVQQAVARAEMRYLVEQQRREQEQLRRLLVEWRYRVLQAQMNPHFLFNALNTVHYYILHNDREALLRFVAQFARLMRNVLQLVERTLVPLRQELETTELYLQLEQARFRHAFDYVLHVEPDVEVDEILCPSLLLQPLVENAIKHGLGPRGGRGTIRVCVRLEGESVLCCIEDDGVGRRQQGAAGEHSGAGLRLTQERLALLSRQLKKPFTLQIVDLTRPDGSPAGTRVEIRLPQELDLSVRAELEFLESTAA